MLDLLWAQALPLALSATMIAKEWLVGGKRLLGWVLGLAGQGGWITFAILFHAYGLLLLEVTLTVVYALNVHRWATEGCRRNVISPARQVDSAMSRATKAPRVALRRGL